MIIWFRKGISAKRIEKDFVMGNKQVEKEKE